MMPGRLIFCRLSRAGCSSAAVIAMRTLATEVARDMRELQRWRGRFRHEDPATGGRHRVTGRANASPDLRIKDGSSRFGMDYVEAPSFRDTLEPMKPAISETDFRL